MPALSVTTTQTTEVTIAPRLKRKLLTELKAYQSLKVELDRIQTALDSHKGTISKYREEVGEKSIKLEGFTITQVSGTTKKLDKKKLVALGCALAWIDEATTEKPKKEYDLVTCPGEVERVYE